MARLLSEKGMLREIHLLLLYYGIGEEMSREKKIENCRMDCGGKKKMIMKIIQYFETNQLSTVLFL